MNVTGFYPVLMVDDAVRIADCFRDVFGFETTFETDWYVSLRRSEFELAVVDRTHETIPRGFGTLARGVLLNLEVEDAAAWRERVVVTNGLVERLSLRDEEFGQRHFIVEIPGGILVDVIESIEPSGAFALAYTSAAEPEPSA